MKGVNFMLPHSTRYIRMSGSTLPHTRPVSTAHCGVDSFYSLCSVNADEVSSWTCIDRLIVCMPRLTLDLLRSDPLLVSGSRNKECE